MGNTIWENENNSFQKIVEIVKKNGDKKEFGLGHMLQAGRLTKNERGPQKADIYRFKNDNNVNIHFQENDKVAEFTYVYDEETMDQITITYDKTTSQFAYYSHSGATGHNLLAIVSPKEARFPVYGTTMDREINYLEQLTEVGEMPEIEMGSTVRENIEKTLLSNPILEERAYEVLAAFDQILSIDKEREIKPLSPIEIENAKLKAKNAELEAKNAELKAMNAELKAKNAELNSINTSQEAEIGENEKRALSLESELEKLQTQLTSSENESKMLADVIARIKGAVSKIPFFGKKVLKDIGIEERALSQNIQTERKDFLARIDGRGKVKETSGEKSENEVGTTGEKSQNEVGTTGGKEPGDDN